MKPPTKLPSIAATRESLVDLTHIVIISLLIATLAVLLMWPVARAQGVTEGIEIGAERVRHEVRHACGCWYTDSRCKRPKAIIVCNKLDWMN